MLSSTEEGLLNVEGGCGGRGVVDVEALEAFLIVGGGETIFSRDEVVRERVLGGVLGPAEFEGF